jgi:integrase
VVFAWSKLVDSSQFEVLRQGDRDREALHDRACARVRFHDLRHTFASHLIRQGIDPVRASRQLGHARPSITLDIYAHEFDQARGHDDICEKLTAAFGGIGRA